MKRPSAKGENRAFAAATSCAMLAVLWLRGPDSFSENQPTRLLVDAFLIAGLAADPLIALRTRPKRGCPQVVRDERDAKIALAATHVQLWAVLRALDAQLEDGFQCQD